MGITNVYEKTEAQMTTKEKLERDKGLVLHLDFSTPYSADNLILDKSGNNNHATVVPSTAPVWVENGMIGKGAYSFDGGDIITSPLNSVAKTLSIWIKYSTKPLLNSVILTYANSHIGLGFYNSGTQFIICSNRPSKRVCSTETMVDEDWNHVVIIYDENYTPSAFINGVEPRYIETTNNWTEPVSNVLHIGGRSTGDKYNGLVDDVRIYSTALSASEVKELYQTRATVDEGGNLSVMGISLPSAAVSEGLVGWWKLDGNALDSSGNGNDGTVYGATPVDGIIGGAYSFDGVDDYIGRGNTFNPGLSDFSMGGWIMFNSSNPTYLFSQSFAGGGNGRWWIARDIGKSWKFGCSWDNGGHTNYFSTVTPILNVWYCLFITADRDGMLNLYTNGVLSNSISISGESTADVTSNYPFKIGAYTASNQISPSSFASALIQDVRIYNRALEYGEIKLLYSLGVDSIWK